MSPDTPENWPPKFTLGDQSLLLRILFLKVWHHEMTVEDAMSCIKPVPPTASGEQK